MSRAFFSAAIQVSLLFVTTYIPMIQIKPDLDGPQMVIATQAPPAIILEVKPLPAEEPTDIGDELPLPDETEMVAALIEVDSEVVDLLAKVMRAEAHGISTLQKAAVAWCVLNRVDDPDTWGDTVKDVVYQQNQFAKAGSYSQDYWDLAVDVFVRWEREKEGEEDVGRVLPLEYTYFTGDGRQNHFRTKHRDGRTWNWSLPNPYETQTP